MDVASFIDPFQSVELPEAIEEYLEHGVATCSTFNRRGTLLAGLNASQYTLYSGITVVEYGVLIIAWC